MYIHRAIEPLLKEAISQFPAVLVTGPRQAGKSTLLQNTLKNYNYVTLDDPLLRKIANDDPELFLSSHPVPLIIDEIQYAPSLFSYLKLAIDAKRCENGRFVLTGSQTFQVMKGVSESLAGRIAILQLYPFNWTEINVPALDTQACTKQIVQGFYPQFFSGSIINWNLWFGSYISTYLERDVRNIKAITDLGRFQTFISLLAARAGKIFNIAEISKECGISQPTAKDWISILESTYIIFLLKPFHNNLSKRLLKSPKIYFVDTGLLCFLLGIDNEERLLKSSEGGHIFENMVIADVLKKTAYMAKRTELFFYRTASGVEVDLIIKEKDTLSAFEIKFAKSLSREMAKSLQIFLKEHLVQKASVLSLQEKTIMLAENITAEHWSSL
ncbi:MAG: ATP-binding protein [Chlamydiales bacterium]|nr:ATP-binding protein [Chlamydiales bacterium]